MQDAANLKNAPIVKTIEIEAPSELVFEMFVTRFGDWWPRAKFSRTRGATPRAVILEARPRGAIYELSDTGERLEWGIVTDIDPGRSIVMAWHLGRPVETVVEVVFESLGQDRTRVRLEHRGWEKLDAAGATVERQGYDQGWSQILDHAFAPFIATAGRA